MAKQLGNFRFEGRICELVFYKMDGQHYVRQLSSLTGKRVKTKPEFRRTMYYAGLMGRASKIGSLIYKALPENWRRFWMYREFTGEAMKMLKLGKEEGEIISELRKVYVDYWEKKNPILTGTGEGGNYSIIKEKVHYKTGRYKIPVKDITIYMPCKVFVKHTSASNVTSLPP